MQCGVCEVACTSRNHPTHATECFAQITATINLLAVNIVIIAWHTSYLWYLKFTASESHCVLRYSRHKKNCVYTGARLGWATVLTQEKKIHAHAHRYDRPNLIATLLSMSRMLLLCETVACVVRAR
jgi:hypothetical protein